MFFASPPPLFSAHLHLFSVLIIREGGGRRRGGSRQKKPLLDPISPSVGENERRKNPTLYYGLWGGAKVSFSFNLSQKCRFEAALARWEITVNERFLHYKNGQRHSVLLETFLSYSFWGAFVSGRVGRERVGG